MVKVAKITIICDPNHQFEIMSKLEGYNVLVYCTEEKI